MRVHRPWASAAIATLIVLFLAAALAVIGPLPAGAHDSLLSADPAAGSVLAAPPATITLTFSAAIKADLSQVAITVGGTSHTVTPTVTGSTLSGRVPEALLSAPVGPAEVWKVGYRIVSSDGHPISGLLEFTVGADPARPESSDAPPAPAGSDSPPLGLWIAAGAGIAIAVGAWWAVRRRRGP